MDRSHLIWSLGFIFILRIGVLNSDEKLAVNTVFLGSVCYHPAVPLIDKDIIPKIFENGDDHLEDPTAEEIHGDDGDLSPWLVSLQDLTYKERFHICGGTLLTAYFVLTTAFCVKAYKPGQLQASAGIRLNSVQNAWQAKTVKEFHLHEDYNPFTRENDLALLLVAGSFTFNQYVHPLPIGRRGIINYEDCTFSGWRRNSRTGSIGVQFSKISWSPLNECNEIYHGLVTQNMLCIDLGNWFESFGNWGGPLSCDGHELTGIASWRNEKSKRYPTVFVSVAKYASWIDNTIY